MFPIPAAIRTLLLINVAVYALQLLDDQGQLESYLGLWSLGSDVPGTPGFQPWQLITYAFLHDPKDPLHLLSNMFFLVMLGGDVERVWGRSRFLTYYFTCVLSAALTQLLVQYATDSSPASTIGASGGVFGVLLAFGMLFPQRTVRLIIMPFFPIPAWLYVGFLGLIELFAGVRGAADNVAHFAHLGGALGGYLLIRYGRARRS